MTLTALAAAAGTASADQVFGTVETGYHSVFGLGAALTVHNGSGWQDVDTVAGRQRHNVVSATGMGNNFVGTQQWFCIEATDTLDVTTTYDIKRLRNAPDPGDGISDNEMGVPKEIALRRLWYAADNAASWQNTDHFLTGTSQTARNNAAMFQVLVWEIIHEDTFTTNITLNDLVAGGVDQGEFYVRSDLDPTLNQTHLELTAQWNGVDTFLQYLLSALNTAGPVEDRLYAFTDPFNQDLFGRLIPLPYPAMTAGLGLIGLVSIRRRRSV